MSLPVTIVVCTYCDHEFLTKCLNSCIEQDCAQIVLVDDGTPSWGLPANVMATVKDYKIDFVRHGENRGLAAARNTGFGLARNEWIIPLDADDVFYPGGVEALYETAIVNNRADVIVGDLTENKVVCRPPVAQCPADGTVRMMTIDQWRKQNMGFSTSLVRRTVWEKYPYIADRKIQYEDYRWFISMWLRGGASWRYVPFTVYDHAVRPDGMLRRMDKDRTKYHAEATELLR